MPRTSPSATRDLNSRNNSLNLIRLLLAWSVLLSHASIITGTGDGIVWEDENLGGWAVIGFFTISGFLISGSRFRADGAKFLFHRIVRIFPGYILSLFAVAFLFAPIAQIAETGGLDNFFGTSNTPLNYIWGNSLLKVNDYSVAQTIAKVPYPHVWNGSLWSLYYEFWCYIIIGVFLSWSTTRLKTWPTLLIFALSVAIQANIAHIAPYFGNNPDVVLLVRMLPYFLGGTVIYVCHRRIIYRWYIALPLLIAAVLAIHFLPGFGKQLAAPLVAYIVLWLGLVLPSPRFVQVHDLSYGMYIFAFPISQLMVVFGLHRQGFLLYLAVVTLLTVTMAAASWFGIERASMRWSRGLPPWGDLTFTFGRRTKRIKAAGPHVPQPTGLD